MIDFKEKLRDYAQQQGWKQPTASVIYDEPNLRLAGKKKYDIRVDLKKVQDLISKGYWKCIKPPFVVTDADDVREKIYFRMLEDQGFCVLPIVGKNSGGTRVSRTDGFICGKIVEEGLGDCDIIILVSGDGDFEPVLRQIKEKCGKRIIIFTIRGALASSLHSIAEVNYIGEDCGMYQVKELC